MSDAPEGEAAAPNEARTEVPTETGEAPRPTQMTDKERRYGNALGLLCLVAFPVPWLSKAVSGNTTGIIGAVVGTVLSVALLLAVRRGHRVLTMLAAVLTGFSPAHALVALVAQLACLVYAGWVMLKTNRAVRESGVTPAQRSRARKEARAARRNRGAAAATPISPSGRPRATASKRYTPPQQKKRR